MRILPSRLGLFHGSSSSNKIRELGKIEAIRKQYVQSDTDRADFAHIARISEDESAVQELRTRMAHYERKIDRQNYAQVQLER